MTTLAFSPDDSVLATDNGGLIRRSKVHLKLKDVIHYALKASIEKF